MKIHKKVILLLLFAVNAAFAQWVQISTIGNNELHSVKFFNEFTGIVVGQGGIWRSIDSGLNWSQVLSGSNLNALHFPTDNTGYAVGDTGKIYKTTNNGINWAQLNSTTSQNLLSVHFINQSTGQVAGMNGIMLRTQTEGSIFSQQTAIGDDYYDIIMINAGTIYSVGSTNYETVITSLSGGTQWSGIYYLSGNGFRSLGIVSLTPQHSLICVGLNGRIRYTTNAGFNWVSQTSTTNQNLNYVTFINFSTGFIAGNNGIILKTTNTGTNWTSQNTGTTNNLKALNFINSETGWTVGSNGIVLRTGIPVGINFENEISKEYTLFQNYPNPFNPTTVIKFQLVDNTFIKLELFDLSGKLVKHLIAKNYSKGIYEYTLDTKSLSSGAYIYSLKINESMTLAKKLIIIK